MNSTSDLKSVCYYSSIEEIVDFIYKIPASQKFILCDHNTYKHCFIPYFSSVFSDTNTIIIKPGDENKNAENFVFVSNELANKKADKNTLLINLGGGMITDLGGFVASVFKRGIRFTNIPTSTLAMADAAYGGKTAINLPFLKNAIGTFYSPENICISTQFIKTLNPREHVSGFAEIIKMMLLFDANNWNEFSKHKRIPSAEDPLLLSFIKKSIEAKSVVVHEDPDEKGLRKILNYGHSIGHAIEAVYNQNSSSILHGEAIFWGMQLENRIAMNKGIMKSKTCFLLNSVLEEIFSLPKRIENIPQVIDSLRNDKKNNSSKINMALLIKPGQFVQNIEVSIDEVTNVLENFQS